MILPILLPFAAALAQPAVAVAIPQVPRAARHSRRLFVSPMGEPFAAGPGGDALADWFAKADRNHDGMITRDEMQADAERFFATLDVNHDGEIDPDETTRYETQLAPANRRSLGLLNMSEPVAAADANFNRGISLDEFRSAAQKRFAALDLGHQGRLTLNVLEEIRPAGPPREKRDFDAGPELDPNADTGG